MENKNKKKKIVTLMLVIVVLILSFSIGMNFVNNKGVINTDGIKVNYRVYTDEGWSKWYKNGQIAGRENKSIKAIEAKIETEKYGHILYNIYSSNNNFDDNDTYDGETAGDKEKAIYGMKFFLTDDLYKEYQIYYRTHNKKDGWLDWTSKYNISGDNEVDIDELQIKVLKIDDVFEQNVEKASIGF